MMKQKEYNQYLKIVKQNDKMPYEEIVLVEAIIKEKQESLTPDTLYKRYLSKIMDREIFDSIIKFFRITGRIDIERDNGLIVWLWDPVGVEKLEKKRGENYNEKRKKTKETNKSYLRSIS